MGSLQVLTGLTTPTDSGITLPLYESERTMKVLRPKKMVHRTEVYSLDLTDTNVLKALLLKAGYRVDGDPELCVESKRNQVQTVQAKWKQVSVKRGRVR